MAPEEMVERAMAVATLAHEQQVDKAGNPYIAHPARVAAMVADQVGTDARHRAVAWLHDVVEDTEVTLEDLRCQGFPEEVVAAVDAMTKRPGEPMETYYLRVRTDPLARSVKQADLADNRSPARLAQLDPQTQDRLLTKYTRGLALLGGGEPIDGNTPQCP